MYDEVQFQHLDYIIDSAARHGIKLILALGDSDFARAGVKFWFYSLICRELLECVQAS